MYIVYILISVAVSIGFGIATNKIIENKGYYDNWFWWGFFFGWIALIVALTKPEARHYSRPSGEYYETYFSANSKDHDYEQQLLASGGWKCACGRVNAGYVSSCSCGKSKNQLQLEKLKKDNEAKNQIKERELTVEKIQTETATEFDKIAAIKEYKKLLDDGAISQAEFDAKKKQLLGL